MRKNIKTTIRQAIDYWQHRISECDLSVDWAEADTHCWRYGCQKNLERCHIIPDSLGGKDEPGNIVLLCKRCHQEGPNVTDPEIMWDWIKAYKVPLYETFWQIRGAKEYAFIYKKNFIQEMVDILAQSNKEITDEDMKDIILQTIEAVSKEAGMHFGQPYFNTATIAGLYRMMLKSLAKTYGVPFPIPADNTPRKPWYVDYMFF